MYLLKICVKNLCVVNENVFLVKRQVTFLDVFMSILVYLLKICVENMCVVNEDVFLVKRQVSFLNVFIYVRNNSRGRTSNLVIFFHLKL